MIQLVMVAVIVSVYLALAAALFHQTLRVDEQIRSEERAWAFLVRLMGATHVALRGSLQRDWDQLTPTQRAAIRQLGGDIRVRLETFGCGD